MMSVQLHTGPMASNLLPDQERLALRMLEEKGYAVLDFSSDAEILDLCDAARAETHGWFNGGAIRVQDAWRQCSAVRQLAAWPVVNDLLERHYGRRPVPFQTLNFEHGTEQGVHSDAFHFRSEPDGLMCGVWFALEDITADAGPLVYYPGSHHLPVIGPEDLGATADMKAEVVYETRYLPAIQQVIADQDLLAEHALLKKGQALIWDANLLHGGSKISSQEGVTRASQVTHYFFSGCDYFTPALDHEGNCRRQRRLPFNIASGRPVWPSRKGLPLPVELPVIRGALGAAMKRYVHVVGGASPLATRETLN